MDDNAPSKLSDSANAFNRRRLLINAQITAMTTLMELLGGVALIIQLGVVGRHSFSLILQAVAFRCVVMPYAFLKNTSHNKSRIIDEGWNNVIRNILKPPTWSRQSLASDENKNDGNPEEENHSKIPKRKRIPTISSSVNDHRSTAIVEPMKNMPSCSQESCTKKNETSEDERNKVSQILDVKILGEQNYVESMLYNLSYSLTQNLENEKEYKKEFEKLVTFLEYQNAGKLLSHNELEEKFPNCVTQNKEISKKKSKKKANSQSSPTSSRNATRSSSKFHMEDNCANNEPNPIVKEAKEDRTQKRQEILDELLLSCKDKDKREFFLDQLIDLEESFVLEQK